MQASMQKSEETIPIIPDEGKVKSDTEEKTIQLEAKLQSQQKEYEAKLQSKQIEFENKKIEFEKQMNQMKLMLEQMKLLQKQPLTTLETENNENEKE